MKEATVRRRQAINKDEYRLYFWISTLADSFVAILSGDENTSQTSCL